MNFSTRQPWVTTDSQEAPEEAADHTSVGSVTVPVGVIESILPSSVLQPVGNQIRPSGPVTIPDQTCRPALYSPATAPAVVILRILKLSASVTHTCPSGPLVMPSRYPRPDIVYSVIAPAVVILPTLFVDVPMLA